MNGAEGMGTGWSTKVPSYSPLDIVENLKRKLKGEDMVPMVPWYRGFTGTVSARGSGSFVTKGVITPLSVHFSRRISMAFVVV